MRESETSLSEIKAIWRRGKETYLPSALMINAPKVKKSKEKEISSTLPANQNSSGK